MNRLQLRYDIAEQTVTVRPFVDGIDILDGYRNSQGRDPDDLLPPLSTQLLPTRGGHPAILGVCSCGEPGCGSLAVSIRRAGSEVLWQPAEIAGYETLRRSYRFELVPYLEAVDTAAGDPPAGEGTGRRVARRVRAALGMYDLRYGSLAMFHEARIDWISAWPWRSHAVKASVTTTAGQTVHEYTAELDETEDQFAARVTAELARFRLASNPDGDS
jgi:hypothetical protein